MESSDLATSMAGLVTRKAELGCRGFSGVWRHISCTLSTRPTREVFLRRVSQLETVQIPQLARKHDWRTKMYRILCDLGMQVRTHPTLSGHVRIVSQPYEAPGVSSDTESKIESTTSPTILNVTTG